MYDTLGVSYLFEKLLFLVVRSQAPVIEFVFKVISYLDSSRITVNPNFLTKTRGNRKFSQ